AQIHLRRHRETAREGGSLRRSVAVDHSPAAQRLERAPHVRHRQDVAAGEKLADPRERLRVRVDELVEEPGRQPQRCNRIPLEPRGKLGERRYVLWEHYEPTAVEECAPDLERGGIE